MEFIIVSIDNPIHREDFDCGIAQLNDYLKKYARQNDRKGIAKTFVAIADLETRIAIGYYSVSMDKIEFESLPTEHSRKIPRYPLPAMLIGKLAVDRSIQGRGLGKELLMDAFKRAVRLSSDVGIFAVTIDATNQAAKTFYLKYGFISLENNPLSLFIPISTIIKVLK